MAVCGDKRPPKVADAEITEDGSIVVKFNGKLRPYPHTDTAIFTPELLLALVEEYSEIPPAGDTDYPGVPIVDHDGVFEGDGEATKRERKKGT